MLGYGAHWLRVEFSCRNESLEFAMYCEAGHLPPQLEKDRKGFGCLKDSYAFLTGMKLYIVRVYLRGQTLPLKP